MREMINWWRGERAVTLAKSLLLGLLPLTCCLVYCAAQGRSLGEVYLPGSEWNDELFYYKQVEGIVHYGYPQGYFGFNESHALKLSFAAWSPVLVFPWVLWGLVFGWNLMSPILCNIVLMTLCCVLFVWLVRPAWKQLGVLAFLFCLYRPFVRYMLSGMPEVICFTMLILFCGLAVNYLGREKEYKLVLLFVLAGVMALMRPYLLLFLLLPSWLWIRSCRGRGGVWRGILGSLGVLALVAGLYACIKHYLGAEYFAPLFFTDWVTAFFEQGILEGIRFTLGKIYYMGKDFFLHILQAFRSGLASGAYFAGFVVCTGVLAVQSLKDWGLVRRRRRSLLKDDNSSLEEDTVSQAERRLPVEACLLFGCVGMFFALLLMYKLTEGSRHLVTFMAAAVFVTALMETKFYKKAVLLGVTFAYFYSYMALNPYDYQVPYAEERSKAAQEEWSRVLEEKLALDRRQSPGFENVVIWVLMDDVDGTSVSTSWQLLYGLPRGFGISCCLPEYVLENFDSLQSRYLASPAGGEIEKLCQGAGYSRIYGDQDMVLYERR